MILSNRFCSYEQKLSRIFGSENVDVVTPSVILLGFFFFSLLFSSLLHFCNLFFFVFNQKNYEF